MPDTETKVCPRCGLGKPIHAYYRNPNSGYVFPHCRDCANRNRRARYASDLTYADRQRRAATRAHESGLDVLYRYGLLADEVRALLAVQGFACAVCERPLEDWLPGERRGWTIDHDHDCCPENHGCLRCVRGLLCHRCNSALGWFEKHSDAVSAYLCSRPFAGTD